jgi:hypothetical protein
MTYNTRQQGFALLIALVMGLSLVAPAAADNTVTLEVRSGDLSFFIDDFSMGSINYEDAPITLNGAMTLHIDDGATSVNGYGITINGSDFTGGEFGGIIEDQNFTITGAGAIHHHNGQDPAGTTAYASGNIGNGTPLFNAPVGSGNGQYSQPYSVQLFVPGDGSARPGNYTATLVLTSGLPF